MLYNNALNINQRQEALLLQSGRMMLRVSL